MPRVGHPTELRRSAAGGDTLCMSTRCSSATISSTTWSRTSTSCSPDGVSRREEAADEHGKLIQAHFGAKSTTHEHRVLTCDPLEDKNSKPRSIPGRLVGRGRAE